MTARSVQISRFLNRGMLAARDQRLRLARTLRLDRSPSRRPLPRVRIGIGLRLPGWALRLCLAAVCLGCTWLLQPGRFLWFVGAVGALLLLVRPGGFVGPIFAAIFGLALALSSLGPFTWRSYALLFGVHLLVQLGIIIGNVGWVAVLELRALLGPARRFLVLQAAAQLLAVSGAAVGQTGVSIPLLPVLVGVGLAVLAWMLLSRLAR